MDGEPRHRIWTLISYALAGRRILVSNDGLARAALTLARAGTTDRVRELLAELESYDICRSRDARAHRRHLSGGRRPRAADRLAHVLENVRHLQDAGEDARQFASPDVRVRHAIETLADEYDGLMTLPEARSAVIGESPTCAIDRSNALTALARAAAHADDFDRAAELLSSVSLAEEQVDFDAGPA